MEQPLNATALDAASGRAVSGRAALGRAASGPAAEPIELSSSNGTSLLKWLLPTLATVLALAVGFRRLRK